MQRKQDVLVFALMFGSLAATPARGQIRRATMNNRIPGRSVALTAGSCTLVSLGDTVTLQWTPEFDRSEAVQGLREFSLLFARAGEENSARRGHGGLRLEAKVSHGRSLNGASLALHNGLVQVAFQPDLSTTTADNYYLVEAGAAPSVAAEYSGDSPVMTHDPVRSGYCITVLPSESGSQ